jgi:hypothetical protein
MTIRTIRVIPSQLPHARVYLDDIEEISGILQDAIFQSDQSKMEKVNSKILAALPDSTDPVRVKELLQS